MTLQEAYEAAEREKAEALRRAPFAQRTAQEATMGVSPCPSTPKTNTGGKEAQESLFELGTKESAYE